MPAGSLDPSELDTSSVSPGPWDDDASVDTEIEDANGHRVARIFKRSNVDNSVLPWAENKQLIQDAIGYATQASDRADELARQDIAQQDLGNQEILLRGALADIEKHPHSALRVIARLRASGQL